MAVVITGSGISYGVTSESTSLDTIKNSIEESSISGFSTVYNAVWNDYADSINVPKDTQIMPGRCYATDGSNYWITKEYCELGILGIASDTYGFAVGIKGDIPESEIKLTLAVSGFVLAYVDKQYPSGTALTCTENGALTEIKESDKIKFPERIVATYWKPQPTETWNEVEVNGRHWVKVR